jgi:hypothetical protein
MSTVSSGVGVLNIIWVSLSTSEFTKHVQSKKELYELIYRNEWYLPDPKSSVVSEHYLLGDGK